MAIFLVLGCIAVLGMWCFTRKFRIGVVKVLCCIVVVVSYVCAAWSFSGPQLLGQKRWLDETPYRQSIIFVLMSLGMVVSSLSSALNERLEVIRKRKEKGESTRGIRLRIDWYEFSRPFLFSVVTYCLLLTELGDQPLRPVSAILAFQNGFFWKTLVQDLAAPHRRQTP